VSDPMIVLDGVTRRFGDLAAVDGISLEIGVGEFFSLLGPSGCGKTTTLRMIAGFEEPDEGRIQLAGDDVTFVSPKRRNVNMVFQDYALFPHMTVAENVGFGLRLRKVGRDEAAARIEEMLGIVRLEGMGDRRPGELSGGQRQRVALARALVNRPAALLLDEPLGALDLKLRREMQLELKRIQKSTGTTFVYVTHDQEEALTMSDRIAIMNCGRVQQLADPRSLYERPDTPFVADFIGTSNALRVEIGRRDGDLAVMDAADGGRICVECSDPVGDAVTVAVRPEKIRIGGADDDPARSRVTGTVVERIYLGSLSQVLVELPSGERLVVHELNDDFVSTVGPGDAIELSWAARHSLVVDGEMSPAGLPGVPSRVNGELR
jgi:spermidine/putrescine transport system ATP-binding protein